MLDSALDFISFIYDCIMYVFNVIVEFFPSPFKEILSAFVIIILIIFALKFVKVVGGLIENIVGVFT